MDKVKKLIAAGASIPGAIREALGMNATELARKYGLSRSSVANHLSGAVRATDDTIAALVAELGGTPDDWRELLWLAGKPAGVELPRAAHPGPATRRGDVSAADAGEGAPAAQVA